MELAHFLSTLRKENEALNAAETRKRYRNLVNQNLPAIVIDAEGSIRFATPAACRALGAASEDLLDHCFFRHVHSGNLPQVMRDVADMVRYGKSTATWLVRVRSGDGRPRWMKVTAGNHMDEADEAIVLTLYDAAMLG